ncbi:MAG TPA: multiheme c-type cytochrome, partial [bacterium]
DTLDNIDPSVFDGVDIVIGGNQTPVRSPNAALNPLNPMNAGQILTPPANTTTTGDTGEESVAEPATPEIPALETPLKIPKAAGRARKVTRFDITLNSAGEIVDYYFEEINVDDSFEDDPDMTEIMRGYDTEVHSVELSERITRNYAGSQACEECHVGFMAAWEGFGHFSTYDTIEQSDAISDASCVKCHAIGYVEEPRLVSYDLVPDTLRNIGCEGCHNNGYRHITLQNHIATLAPDMRDTVTTTDTMATDITASTCNVCHIGEWAQDFNFQEEFNRSKAICESVGN